MFISVLGISFVYGGLRYLSLPARNIWACEGPALESVVPKQLTLVLFSDWQQSELRSTDLANLRPAQGDNGHSVVCCCRLDVFFFESP